MPGSAVCIVLNDPHQVDVDESAPGGWLMLSTKRSGTSQPAAFTSRSNGPQTIGSKRETALHGRVVQATSIGTARPLARGGAQPQPPSRPRLRRPGRPRRPARPSVPDSSAMARPMPAGGARHQRHPPAPVHRGLALARHIPSAVAAHYYVTRVGVARAPNSPAGRHATGSAASQGFGARPQVCRYATGVDPPSKLIATPVM